ncbi:hypothetical protein SAMN05421823_103389 [Catalinimonas alkaloidigena]|uniref:Glycosyl hydrolase family 76 n=1 Tax=Catalinimonas alkaloidigena TaxID=1075417 RepID=A0A1G9E920_9BACT|nr:hypothetical protein [Catalinimonas alkaloidigena]SDK72607.1 hypothetical protein SAMN05421823_103389 [Catalinimonas alkaloidigena]
MSIRRLGWLGLIALVWAGCQEKAPPRATEAAEDSLDVCWVNDAHLRRLYQEMVLGRDTVGIIHIYSEYPDYGWVDDADEGVACVDDVARAAIFYVRQFQLNHNPADLDVARKLLRFVLHLQADNGYFYNFVWADGQINRTFQTSVAEANWWSWRAGWALTESIPVFRTEDPALAARLEASLNRLLTAWKAELPTSTETKRVAGLTQPTWLPYGNAADQASLLLLVLSSQCPGDSVLCNYAVQLGQGMLTMQLGTAATTQFPAGAFLSWENTWHAWGNDQSYALLRASRTLPQPSWRAAAQRELDHYYPQLLHREQLSAWNVAVQADTLAVLETETFPQIAYGIRPQVWACLEAADLTQDTLYAARAGELAAWFLGQNRAHTPMYDPATGRGFDGLQSADNINRNAGAESTIEALLTLQAIEQHPVARRALARYGLPAPAVSASTD